MSDQVKGGTIEDLEKELAKDAELERLQDEVRFKKATLDKKAYDQKLKEQEEAEKNETLTKKLDFGAMTVEQAGGYVSDWEAYIAAAKKKLTFLNTVFDKVIPFFRKNLILIAAHTGRGKSTAAANIAYSVLGQTSPLTGKSARCLILTNEEKAEDFYARVICLLKGWNYVNHNELTDEQISTIKKAIPVLATSGLLMVIDNVYGGSHGTTTTIEGIEMVFENLLANKNYYDVVIIDYYQNILSSKNNAALDENKSQARLAKMLDHYKNFYPAPIILMAQADPETENDHRPFKQRVNGRKVIMDGTTLAMEMTVDYTLQTTDWTVWKSRYTQFIGKSITTGYKDGKYVEYTEGFKQNVAERNAKNAMAMLDRQMQEENRQSGADLKKRMEESNGSKT